MSESRAPILSAAAAGVFSLLVGFSAMLWAGPASRSAAPGVTLAATQSSASPRPSTVPAATLPRTVDGKPDLQGIWQIHNRAAYDLEDHDAKLGMLAGRTVVEDGAIPYQPWAAAKRADNFARRATADPLEQCYMPGVPRIMYMDFPFHIFQTQDQIAVLFEWSQAFRLLYTNGSAPPEGIDFWMGDSRGRWEGDTLVVNVTNHNDKTWFDMAGNFHSEAMRLVERFTMTGPDTLRYQVTIDDPKVFTRPWAIGMLIERRKNMDRILEYQCNAEVEEGNGAFPRDPLTWYAKPGAAK